MKSKLFNEKYKQLYILFILLFALFLLGPAVYSNQSFFVTLMAFMILSVSLNIIFGYTGYLPFGYSAFFAIGAYGFGIAVTHGWNVFEAFSVGGMVSVALGLVFAPMLKLRGAYFSIANLAAFEGVYYIVSNQSLTFLTGGPYGVSVASVFDPNLIFSMLFVVLIVSIFTSFLIKHGKIGLALRAIKDDQLAATLSGINTSLLRNFAWLTSAFFAGLAGALFGWYQSFFYPDSVFSITITIFIIVFVIVGGSGTVIGPIVGTIFLYSLYDLIGLSYPAYFTLIFGALIIIFVLFMPDGISRLIKKYLDLELI